MQTIEPLVIGRTTPVILEPWNVILLNDDWHTFDEVISQLIKATRCSLERASEITWKVHTKGHEICYTGPKERCEHVASILEEIALDVQIEKTA